MVRVTKHYEHVCMLCLPGIIYCLASLGVAGGYIGGGQFLNIYVDAVTVATEKLVFYTDATFVIKIV